MFSKFVESAPPPVINVVDKMQTDLQKFKSTNCKSYAQAIKKCGDV